MKSAEQIITENTEAINEFMLAHGKDTRKELSRFLFELQGFYLGQTETEWTEKGANEVRLNFQLLYDLVNGVRAVV